MVFVVCLTLLTTFANFLTSSTTCFGLLSDTVRDFVGTFSLTNSTTVWGSFPEQLRNLTLTIFATLWGLVLTYFATFPDAFRDLLGHVWASFTIML